MPSAPINVPSAASSWKSRRHSGLSSSPSDSESSIYVPVHKRAPSSTSSVEDERAHDFTSPEHNVYSIATLLSMQHSPAAKLPREERDSLRAAFPEIIMNRRQRKYQQFVAVHGVPTTHHDHHHDEPSTPLSSPTATGHSRHQPHSSSRTHSTSPNRKPRALPREASDNWRVRI